MVDVIFVFTKQFPFGLAEQYLVDELEYLSSGFKTIVFVPTEIFEPNRLKKRQLTENFETLLLNEEAAKIKTSKRVFEFLSVFIGEWARCRNKTWFWKERKRYCSVLLYQAHLATVMKKILKEKYRNSSSVFYTYWIHNSSIMLGLMKKRGDIKNFICRGHSIDLYEWDWTLTRYIKILPFYYFIIRQSSHIFAISKHGYEYLAKRFPSMSKKFSFNRLGIQEAGNNPFNNVKKFTVVSCSNFSDNKRVFEIAEVVGKMKCPVQWIHFGDGAGREKVEKIISGYPSHCSAQLMGFVPNDEIEKFYKSNMVNLFINLSEAEGIPVSIMEAISFGIPVLASDVYGNPEIANEKTGFSVPFHSSSENIAKIIDVFAEDFQKQKEIRISTKQFYIENFSAEKNYKNFIAEILKYPNA